MIALQCCLNSLASGLLMELNLDGRVELPCFVALQVQITEMQDAKAAAQAWTRGARDKPAPATKREELAKSMDEAKASFVESYKTSLDAQHGLHMLRAKTEADGDHDPVLSMDVARQQ